MQALVNIAQARQLDEILVASSGDGVFGLMERAAIAVVQEIERRYKMDCDLIVGCGPGHNGADGFLVAHRLRGAGWKVEVREWRSKKPESAERRRARKCWGADISPLNAPVPRGTVLIDGFFGTGFSRTLPEEISALFLETTNCDRVAIDMPSGVHAETGHAAPGTPECKLTITFFAKKWGQVLMPGRDKCGKIIVADSGIAQWSDSAIAGVIDASGPIVRENRPETWVRKLPRLNWDDHKYRRGHAVVLSPSEAMTGASRLAATAALRSGAGMVTILASPASAEIHRGRLDEVLVREVNMPFENHLADSVADLTHPGSVILGPGGGGGAAMRDLVGVALELQLPLVLDADALTSFEGHEGILFDAIQHSAPRSDVVLTPHFGEFSRLFPELTVSKPASAAVEAAISGIEMALHACERSGAMIVLKSATTVIAHSARHATVQPSAPPTLATAGSGDVLSGILGGLLAGGMPGAEAACSAVWIHARAASTFGGRGLIASDLVTILPKVLDQMQAIITRQRTVHEFALSPPKFGKGSPAHRPNYS